MVDEIDGKSLGFGLGRKSVSAKRAQSYFPHSHPVEGLLVLPAEHDIHLAEKPPNEFRAQLWMIIEIAQFACAKARIARVQADNFPFPLGMKEIPIRLNSSALASFRIVRDRKSRNAPFIDEYVPALGLNIDVLPFPPERSIHDFRKE